jgi:hypothetical protein
MPAKAEAARFNGFPSKGPITEGEWVARWRLPRTELMESALFKKIMREQRELFGPGAASNDVRHKSKTMRHSLAPSGSTPPTLRKVAGEWKGTRKRKNTKRTQGGPNFSTL